LLRQVNCWFTFHVILLIIVLYFLLIFFAQCSYKKFHAWHVIKIFFPHRIFSWTQSYLFIVLDIRSIRRRPRFQPHNACKSYIPDFDFSRRSIDSRMNRLSLPVNYVVARCARDAYTSSRNFLEISERFTTDVTGDWERTEVGSSSKCVSINDEN